MFRRRRKRKDPVTPQLRAAVIARDNYLCVAAVLDPKAGECRNEWGEPIPGNRPGQGHWLTLDHVREEPMMGKRAPSDLQHLVSLCWSHHLNGWATAHRPLLREYLKEVSPE